MALKQTLRIVGSAAAAGALLFSTATTASADQVRKDQWVLGALGAEKIWKVATGKGVTVAVIDNGVLASHPDLVGNVLKGKDFIDGDSDASPEAGEDADHGTGMAGVIAGHGHGAGGADGVKGLAPDAKILPIRDDGGSSGFASSIRYAVDHGAKVINISLYTSNVDVDSEREAIQYALGHNVIVVAGMGNNGKTGAGALGYPALDPGVVAVGAIKNTARIWEKSNYGPQTLLTAPGVNIVSTGTDSDGYRMGTGTSDSTAYVSAACALLREKFPDLTAGQIVNRLTKTAGLPKEVRATAKLPDEKYGYGYIQPLAALTENIPAGPKNGPLTMPAADPASSGAGTGTGKAESTPPASSADKSDDSGSSSSTIIGVVVGALVVLLVGGGIALFVVRSKRGSRRDPAANQFPGPGSYPTSQPNQPPQRYGDPGAYQQPMPPTAPPNQPPSGGGNPYQQ
ncbi:S8 family serine peptidase [Streptomyces beijiangensis]|uniref:S8 family serine peptidase n=1 Tax=Streptomyces beijiangensis TaxID=163361 RepID=A0A939JKQ4_9ACTN|nr:S8 family serine peptidase [Streptomyces beijiangensis]MBO0515540.1 S8 family serine peptidase [Streptomyces beijiangensis]